MWEMVGVLLSTLRTYVHIYVHTYIHKPNTWGINNIVMVLLYHEKVTIQYNYMSYSNIDEGH